MRKELYLELRPYKNYVVYCHLGTSLVPISLSQVEFCLILSANCTMLSKSESIWVEKRINIESRLINPVSQYSDSNFLHISEASPMSPICNIGSII